MLVVAEVGVPELALDDGQRHALAGEFERVRVTQLARREPAPDARPDGDAAELATDGRANERSVSYAASARGAGSASGSG